MLQVHILPGNPKIIEGTSPKTGRQYRIVQQAAYCVLPDGSAASFTIQPQRDAKPYPPGPYTLSPDSFYVMEGELRCRPILVAQAGK